MRRIVRYLFPRFGGRTIARDLTIGLASIVTAILIFLGMAVDFVVTRQIESNLYTLASDASDELAAILSLPLWTVDVKAVRDITEAYQHLENIASVRVLDEKNTPVYVSPPHERDKGQPVITAEKMIFYNKKPVGRVEVSFLAVSVGQAFRTIFLATALVIVLIDLTILLGIRILLKKFLTQPLNSLTQGIDRVAQGNYTHILERAPQADVNEIVQRANVMISQIAERMDALRLSEERFRQVIISISDQVYVIEVLDREEKRSRYFSPDFKTLTGYPLERFMEDWHFWHTLIFPVDQGRAAEQMERLTRGENSETEYRLQCADGRLIWVRDSARVEQSASSRLIYGVISNITQRKRAEERLNAIVENMPNVAIQAYDRYGRVVLWNKAATHLYGWTESEALGKTPDLLMLDSSGANQFVQHLREIEHTGLPVGPLEGEFHNRKGEKGMITSMVFAVPGPEGQQQFICADVDITARKRLEEENERRLAEVEAVNRLSGALRVAESLDTMLPLLMDETLAAIHAQDGSILLYDAATDSLNMVIERGWFARYGLPALKPGQGIGGNVFLSGQAYTSAEFSLDPLTHPIARSNLPAGWGGACLPIRAAQDVVGVMFVSQPVHRPVSSNEMHLLGILAEIAGSSVHRMQLYEKNQQQVQRLQALHSIDIAIASVTDLRVILNILLNHLISQLDIHAAAISLYNPLTHQLEYGAQRGFRTLDGQHAWHWVGGGYARQSVIERRLISIPDLGQVNEPFAQALRQSGEGFAAYYGAPLVAKGQVVGVIELFHRVPLPSRPDWLDFLDVLAGQTALAIDNARLFDSLQRTNFELSLAYDATIEGWTRALDLRDRETEGHTQRVVELTIKLARMFGMNDSDLIQMRRGALLHDIGKMGVPDPILLKPGPLTEDEWLIMRQHPQYAYDMLSHIAFVSPALDIPYCHHEKWDGSGYPRGLTGEHIPRSARIFAVVDVWDALCSPRPYRSAMPVDKVVAYIREQSGKHFEPLVVDLFIQLLRAERVIS